MKTLINQVKELTKLFEIARDKYNAIMEEYDDLLCDDKITIAEYTNADIKAEEQTQCGYYRDKLFATERKLIQEYKRGLQLYSLVDDNITNLFNEASKSIVIHNKLIKHILGGDTNA